jgi:hypothetical protein
MFVTSQGSPYARFSRALTTGNLLLVRAAALELPRVDLPDALRICLLIHRGDPDRYEQAAIRWLGRLCLEHPELGFDELAEGLAAFQALPSQPAPARLALRALCARVGLDTGSLGE